MQNPEMGVGAVGKKHFICGKYLSYCIFKLSEGSYSWAAQPRSFRYLFFQPRNLIFNYGYTVTFHSLDTRVETAISYLHFVLRIFSKKKFLRVFSCPKLAMVKQPHPPLSILL